MKITDFNRHLNSRGQFQIQVDKRWHTIDAAVFFDYLYDSERIDGHDPEEETAWTSAHEVRWSPARQEPIETGRCNSSSYETWLEEFADNDAVLIEFIKWAMILEPELVTA